MPAVVMMEQMQKDTDAQAGVVSDLGDEGARANEVHVHNRRPYEIDV